mgnify:CR=1 FL=1
MKPMLWIAAILATIGFRGASLLMLLSLMVGGVWYLMVRRDRQIGPILATATEKLRGLGG